MPDLSHPMPVEPAQHSNNGGIVGSGGGLARGGGGAIRHDNNNNRNIVSNVGELALPRVKARNSNNDSSKGRPPPGWAQLGVHRASNAVQGCDDPR